MAKPDWGAIKALYQSGESVRSFAARFGISHTAINKRAKKEGWEKVSTSKKVSTEKFPVSSGNQDGNLTKSAPDKASGESEKSTAPHTPEKTKPVRDGAHPPFQPHNQHAVKHGGYGRRMLLSDEKSEDALAIWLDDELFWLRAANLTAAETIGRCTAQLEAGDVENEKELYEKIASAYNSMHRNTARIESLERTKADIPYRIATTEKVELENGVMKDGSKDNAVVVHNALPLPNE